MFRELAAGAEVLRAEHDRDMTLAWTVAILSRQQKVPALDRLLSRRRRLPPQSPAEMRKAVDMLAKMFGGRVRVIDTSQGQG